MARREMKEKTITQIWPTFLSKKQTANYLNCSVRFVEKHMMRWEMEGLIKSFRLDGKRDIRIPREHLDNLIRSWQLTQG